MDQSYQEQQQAAPYTEFFSWGSDSYGQLALANSDEDDKLQQYQQRNAFYDQPKSLSFDITILQISCGDYHAAFISGDGFVFSVGRNTEGQLGVGDSSLQQSSAPLLIDTLPKSQPSPKVLRCGGYHTAIIMDNGELYTWGQGQYGALGQSTTQNVFSPVQVQPQNDKYCRFVNIDCGKRNTMAIDSQGRIYISGENMNRQLGVPNKDQINTLTWLQDFTEKAKSVALGLDHSLILTEDDRIFACGNNNNGNLGLGHSYSTDSFLQVHGLLGQKIKQIEAGRHSAAITQEGRLYVWGPVFKGESNLLLPQELRSSKLMKKISIGEKDSIVIDQDNQLYSWGLSNLQASNANQMPTLIETLASKVITQVEVGLEFFVALGQDFNENGDPIDNVYQSVSVVNQYNHDQSYAKQDYQSQHYNYKQQDKSISYSPYQVSKDPVYGSKDNLNRSDHGKPPIVSDKQSYHNQDSQLKKDNSMISNSSRDPTFQYSHIQPKPIESDLNNSFQKVHTETIQEKYKPSVTPNGTISEGRITNADLYRQLDVVKDENHQLKQKNRELMHKVNQLKVENENIISNADSEIKRMSEFIDQYTQEVETSKKEFEDDLQQKLQQERRQNEQLKQKMHQDQNELDSKLDNLQREIERLRRENMQLSQDRVEQQNKNRQLSEQLEHAQQKINQLQQQNQRDYTTISPISTSKQSDRYPTSQYQHHYSRTPNNLHSQQMNNVNQQSRTQDFQNNDNGYSQQLSTNANNSQIRESQTPLLNASRRRGVAPADFSPIPSSYDQHSTIEHQRLPNTYPRQRESEQKERQSPQRIANMLGIKSPIREGVAYEALQPTDYQNRRDKIDYSYEDSRRIEINQRTEQKPYPEQRKLDESQTYSYNDRQYPAKSPLKSIMDDAYEVQAKLQHQLQNSMSNYSPHVHKREEQRSAIRGDKESPALNDVKNRLAVMQKNKEELEEKLKNYEAKIRQHFNR